jgi:putative transposase
MMVKKFPFIREVYRSEMSLWSIGYFVSTVGANEETIRAYIEIRAAKIAATIAIYSF